MSGTSYNYSDAGTVYVPDGHVVTGIRVTNSTKNGTYVGSVALRYLPITALFPPSPYTITWSSGQTGSPITVSPDHTTSYTATAANAYGTLPPASLTITVNTLPTPYSVTGEGANCQGSGVAVGLAGSQGGVNYQLRRDGSNVGNPVTGTGSAINFGNQTVAGNYTVLATDATTFCQQTMTSSATVTFTPLPAAPSLVTASGYPYPAGQPALTISQNVGSVILVSAGCPGGTLTLNGSSSPTLVVGTTQTGIQTFTATCTSNGCTSPTSTATVTVVLPTLKVLSRDPDNGQLNNNTIKPYLLLQNAGTTPIAYSTITLRYWLTTENNIPLNFQKNYVQIGQGNLNLRYVSLNPARQGATGYIEYSFSAGAGSLAPNGDSGPLEVQVTKQDYSVFNQRDDYSYINNSSFTLNPRITAYQNGVIFYGQEPTGTGGARTLVEEVATLLQVKVLGNPVVGQSAEVEIRGVSGQAVQLKLVGLQGKTLHVQSIKEAGSVDRVSLPLGNAQGILLLDVSTATQRQQIKLLRP